MATTKKAQEAHSSKMMLEKNDGKKQMKPYCEEAQKLAELKRKVEELKPAASEWLQQKLASNPETKDFTGTVLCLYDGVPYKIRVQYRTSCDWREKKLKDPRHKQLLDLYSQQDKLKQSVEQLEGDLATDHPKCIKRDFVMSFLSK